MEDTAHSNAGLMRRIVQLEAEKDELHRDIEKLCTQQSGFSGSVGIVSRMQARRSANFEQELEACKQKLALQTKDHLGLQEELTEIYRTKGRVADALKASMDKNKELEKEVKFYQSRMAGAFTERDKAFLELDKLQSNEKSMISELKELQSRLKKSKSKYSELEKNYNAVQESMDIPALELKRVQKVVEKFWRLREVSNENGDLHDDVVDKVQILLEDTDENWVFGSRTDGNLENSCKTLEVALNQAKEELGVSRVMATEIQEELSRVKSASINAEEELQLAKSIAEDLKQELSLSKSATTKLEEELCFANSVSAKVEEYLVSTKSASLNLKEELEQKSTELMDLKLQLENEQTARKTAEESSLGLLAELATRKKTLEKEIQQLQVEHASLRTVVSTSLDSVKGEISLIDQSVLNALERVKSDAIHQESISSVEKNFDPLVGQTPHEQKVLRVHFADEGSNQSPSKSKDEKEAGWADDSKEMLAQALQEKVEALLLLSQQEERHCLEASTQSALESQVTMLNQMLAQVTREKVSALMELADTRQIILELQGRQREVAEFLDEQKITCPPSRAGVRVASNSGGKIMNHTLENNAAGKTKLRFMPNGGYLKGWLRSLDMSGFKSTSSDPDSSKIVAAVTTTTQSQGGDSVSRLLVENAALQEHLVTLDHFAKSAHDLRMRLVAVAADSQGELEPLVIESAIKVLQSVKSEAKELIINRQSSLPVSFQGALENLENMMDNSSKETSQEEIVDEGVNKSQDGSHQNSVTFAGMEMVEALLATAELQTDSLLAKLKISDST